MFSGCTDKNVHTTGLTDHLLFDHYAFIEPIASHAGIILPKDPNAYCLSPILNRPGWSRSVRCKHVLVLQKLFCLFGYVTTRPAVPAL